MRSKGSLSHKCIRPSASSLILSNEVSWLSTPASSESATSSHASRISSASSIAARCLLASVPESASACFASCLVEKCRDGVRRRASECSP